MGGARLSRFDSRLRLNEGDDCRNRTAIFDAVAVGKSARWSSGAAGVAAVGEGEVDDRRHVVGGGVAEVEFWRYAGKSTLQPPFVGAPLGAMLFSWDQNKSIAPKGRSYRSRVRTLRSAAANRSISSCVL